MMTKSNRCPLTVALALAGVLTSAPLPAQEQLTPPSEPGYARNAFTAPVGHRQPRATDIPASGNKTEAELLEERQQAELNRKLRICRGC